jgi:hypothetical protein
VFGRGNYDVADEILSPTMISHGPGSPPVVGAEPIKRQAALLRGAFPDCAVTLADQFATGDRVCSRWSSTGTHTGDLLMPTGPIRATGSSIALDEIRIDRHVNGRIVESWFIPEGLPLMRGARRRWTTLARDAHSSEIMVDRHALQLPGGLRGKVRGVFMAHACLIGQTSDKTATR